MRAHLGAFGLVLLLPAIIIAGIGIELYQRVERERVEQTAVDLARSANRAIDGEISNEITVLNTLAASDYLDRHDYAAFYKVAKLALEGDDTYIVLIDESVRQVLNTRVPFGTALPSTADPETARTALRTGRPQVSNLFSGAVAREPVFIVVVPVVRDGRVISALVGTRNARSLTDQLRLPETAKGWTVGVFDRNGTIMAESNGSGKVVGRAISADTRADMANPPGVGIARGLDGVEMLRGYARSDLTGWTAAAFIPREIVEAPLQRSWIVFTLAVIGLIVVSVAVAALFARITARAIGDIRQGARALGSGQPVAETVSSLRETNEVSRELALAARLRNQREAQLRFLMSELSHRTKNLLTVAVAIARQTRLRSCDLDDFEERFSGRLVALGRSIDALIKGDWKGADLAGIVRSHLVPFTEPGSRLEIRGPAVALNAEASQQLGIALHELATNASKYGALSVPTGRIAIGWQFVEPDREILRLTWREAGGPPISPPRTSGFGRVVIERLVADQLGATAAVSFAAEGLRWQIDIPVRFVAAEPGEPARHDPASPADEDPTQTAA